MAESDCLFFISKWADSNTGCPHFYFCCITALTGHKQNNICKHFKLEAATAF